MSANQEPLRFDQRVIPCPGCTLRRVKLARKLAMYEEGSLIASKEWAVSAQGKLAELPEPVDLMQTKAPGDNALWSPPCCPHCSARYDADQKSLEDQRAETHARTILDRLRRSGLPLDFVTETDKPTRKLPPSAGLRKAIEVTRKMLAGELRVPWIYLHGKNGSGKTTVAARTLQQAMIAGGRGRFIYWPEWYEKWKGSHGTEESEQSFALERSVIDIPRLVVDELGTERTATQAGADVLNRILDERLRQDVVSAERRPGARWVIFTSNLSIPALVKLYGKGDGSMAARIERRITEFDTAIELG